MKRVVLLVAAICALGLTQARANMDGVVGKIVADLKESTRAVHEINKQNFAVQKQVYQARHQEATTPSPEFVKFKEAEGFKGKMAVLSENFKESCRVNSEKVKERRADIKSHENLKRN